MKYLITLPAGDHNSMEDRPAGDHSSRRDRPAAPFTTVGTSGYVSFLYRCSDQPIVDFVYGVQCCCHVI